MSYAYCGWLQSVFDWVLKKIISPVFEFVKNLLKSVFTTIYNTVVRPILEETLYAALKEIWYSILDIFYSGIYYIAKSFLKLVDSLESIFDILIGIKPVIYNKKEMPLLNALFSMEVVHKAFWYLNFFALGLAVLFAIYGVSRSMMDFDFENKRPVSRVLSSLLRSVLNLFTIQFAVFAMIYLANTILTGIDAALNMAGADGSMNTTIGHMIFVLSSMDAALGSKYNISNPDVESGKLVIGPTDVIRRRFFGTNDLDPYNMLDVKQYFHYSKFNYAILFCAGLAFIIILMFTLVAVIQRLFNLLLLYIASPFMAATIPLDDGERFGKWRELFVGTCFTGYGMLAAMKLYLLICPTIMSTNLQFGFSAELDMYCKVIFMAGGMYAVWKSNGMITSLISQEAGANEQGSFRDAMQFGAYIKKTYDDAKKAKKEKEKKALEAEEKAGKNGQGGSERKDDQRYGGSTSGGRNHGEDNAYTGISGSGNSGSVLGVRNGGSDTGFGGRSATGAASSNGIGADTGKLSGGTDAKAATFTEKPDMKAEMKGADSKKTDNKNKSKDNVGSAVKDVLKNPEETERNVKADGEKKSNNDASIPNKENGNLKGVVKPVKNGTAEKEVGSKTTKTAETQDTLKQMVNAENNDIAKKDNTQNVVPDDQLNEGSLQGESKGQRYQNNTVENKETEGAGSGSYDSKHPTSVVNPAEGEDVKQPGQQQMNGAVKESTSPVNGGNQDLTEGIPNVNEVSQAFTSVVNEGNPNLGAGDSNVNEGNVNSGNLYSSDDLQTDNRMNLETPNNEGQYVHTQNYENDSSIHTGNEGTGGTSPNFTEDYGNDSIDGGYSERNINQIGENMYDNGVTENIYNQDPVIENYTYVHNDQNVEKTEERSFEMDGFVKPNVKKDHGTEASNNTVKNESKTKSESDRKEDPKTRK